MPSFHPSCGLPIISSVNGVSISVKSLKSDEIGSKIMGPRPPKSIASLGLCTIWRFFFRKLFFNFFFLNFSG